MSFSEIFSWINFLMLNLSIILTFLFYIVSVIPLTLEDKIGKKAWKICDIFRIISDLLFLLVIITLLMWVWIPISIFDWLILENYTVVIITSILLAIPCFYILIKALKDAGRETIGPSKETQMYGGIYKHIRHPQILGSILLFMILCLIINSLFILIWITVLMIIIIPIVIYFEEKDLIKKYGKIYRTYKKSTGAIIPRLWRKDL